MAKAELIPLYPSPYPDTPFTLGPDGCITKANPSPPQDYLPL